MKILMVKTSSLGDIIHAFPVLHFLHQEFPEVEVNWVVEKSFSDIVKAHPLVSKVIEIDTKGWRKGIFRQQTWKEILHFRRDLQKEKYDAVIDLQGNTKSAIPTFLARSSHKLGFGLSTIHEWPNTLVTHHRFNPPLHLNVRDENLYIVQHYFQCYSLVEEEKILLKLNEEQKIAFDRVWTPLKELSGEKILVCPGSAWKNKQLSYENLEAFLKKIDERSHSSLILAWGNAEEFKIAAQLQASLPNAIVLEKLSIPVLQNLMSHMDRVIAMDSLPLHLAGTSGTPTFSVFGASSAEKYMPRGNHHIAFQGPCPYGRVFERRCPILRSCPTGLCIRGVDAEALWQKYNEV